MALGDIADSAKEEKKESKLEELKEELGVEDKEELEELNGHLRLMRNVMIAQDKKIERLENRVDKLEKIIEGEDATN